MSYQGLVNEGATCYLNSLLQTLFMTHEFRQNIYGYVHDPKKINQKDSIPFQLQKLFVNLQTKGQPCYTKDLLKSFQWNDAQAFQQHDVQQFCRKLFDAIQASHKNTFWIKELFGFLISSYIDCGTHRSTRPEEYLDLSLPVRNQYTQELYNSIQECLKSYLMPQDLQNVECSGCEKKVNVKKGMALQSMPVIFTIQLNRFELNYQTMQRQKINSFLYYPQILELHRLLKPFNQIQLKGIPPSLQLKKVTVAKQKSRRTKNMDFSSFQVEKVNKRKNSDDKINTKQHVTFLDQQNKDKRKGQDKELSKQEEKQKNLQILASLKQNKFKDVKQIKKQPAKKLQTTVQEDDMLFSTLASGYKFDQPVASSFEPISTKPVFETTQTKYEHQEQSFDQTKQYPQGTYALYAILIHSGGSYGGHYYAYIFDGSEWFKFDDNRVTKVSKYQARQYGSNSEATNGTNAYLLFYRNVKTFKNLKNIEIPLQLIDKVKIENEKSQKRQQVQKLAAIDRQKRIRQINQAVILKIFTNINEPLTLKIQDKSAENILGVRQKIKEALKIEEKDENWRLRRYNKTDDSMHQVYDISLGETSLQNIGFRQNIYLTIQFKKDEQVFEQYDPRKIIVKVNVWKPNIIMVTEKKLKPIKINISQLAKYSDLYELIQKHTNIQNILVIRRNYTSSQPISSILFQENKEKKLIELRFFNNINLYVQEMDQSIHVKWAKQFENERFRCNVKFNNPKQGDNRNQEIYFDTRRTLGQLKKEISQIIGITPQMFRIKKGKQLPQITTFKKKLSDLRFINNQILYIEQGKSSQGSIVIKRGTVQLIQNQIQFFTHEELQVEIGNDLVLAEDLSRKISESKGIPAENIRLRQYIAGQFKEIYLNNQLIMRLRHKSLVWQYFEGERKKGYQIYYRVFDIMNMQVGPLKEIFVDSNASYEQFAYLLEQETGIQSDKILVNKPLSTYCDVGTLLDCEWIQLRYIPEVVKEDPLSIRCDGEFILIKQADQPYKAPKIAKKVVQTTKELGGQAQLKITVIAQKEQGESIEPKEQK